MSRRNAPVINSGSMADIAFLLLIFFLLTTTISAEKGIERQLPIECPNPSECLQSIEEENLITIITNSSSEVMINNEQINLNELKDKLIEFIDNNSEKECNYCHGKNLPSSSEHPKKAYISLQIDPKTNYNFYILIQDEITKAYSDLRSDYALFSFNKPPKELNHIELKQTQKAYPFNLVEVKK